MVSVEKFLLINTLVLPYLVDKTISLSARNLVFAEDVTDHRLEMIFLGKKMGFDSKNGAFYTKKSFGNSVSR